MAGFMFHRYWTYHRVADQANVFTFSYSRRRRRWEGVKEARIEPSAL